MMKVTPNEKINYKYLSYYLNSPFGRYYFKNNAKGANKSMPKITQSVVKRMPILVPPLEEQQEIIEVIDSYMDKINKAEELTNQIRRDQTRILQHISGW